MSDTAQKPAAADLAQIFEPIREDLDAVEREFHRHIQSRVALIPEMGRYIQKSGGKRVRPAVLLMASRLSGYTGDRAVLYASVVEFIHTATLVHDDIIDGADLRRGRLAVHSRWGNDITVLLGDYLYIKSMAMALTYDSLEIIRAAVRRHAADDRRGAVPAHQSGGRRHHRRGALRDHPPEDRVSFRRLCADRRDARRRVAPKRRRALREYGFNLGIAFQLVDDLLDYTADQVALGKPIGADLREGKVTLPVIFLLQRGGEEAGRLIRSVVAERASRRSSGATFCRLLHEHRGAQLAYDRAVEYADRAKACLSVFPPSPETDALAALPDYVLSRDGRPDLQVGRAQHLACVCGSPQRIQQLRQEIRHHEECYYILHAPEISDEEFDRLLHELERLEAEHPDLVTPDSPTQRVAGRPTESFPTVEHLAPMLSLDNAYNEAELRAFDERVRKGAGLGDSPVSLCGGAEDRRA